MAFFTFSGNSSINSDSLKAGVSLATEPKGGQWFVDRKGERGHDKRQLRLMLKHLVYFKKKQIDLNSLIGGLEFLLNALETVDAEWEESLLKAITVLETVNALIIAKESGEPISELKEDKREMLIKDAIGRIENIVNIKLPKDYEEHI